MGFESVLELNNKYDSDFCLFIHCMYRTNCAVFFKHIIKQKVSRYLVPQFHNTKHTIFLNPNSFVFSSHFDPSQSSATSSFRRLGIGTPYSS